ncbi:MAG TPA: DUF5916 domain-containing protein, partial [Terriglobales bacterium]|nr:DUF5916 domain-containing protein [Terriglobales bacterium]
AALIVGCITGLPRAWGQRSAAITRDAVNSVTSFQIPHLTREPKIEDFAGMQPASTVAGMLKIDQFWQHDPIDGQPISQKTEAYLGYTDKNLYVVFLAFDSYVSQLRNHLVRREQINDEDQVGIFLDTFYDHRHCVFFFINPAGVQQEGTYFEGQQDIDLSWDTIWKSETRVVKEGWIGYISIPFKSLRFKSTKSVQEWGVLLERDIPHNNKEHSFSPPNSQNVQGLLTQEGSLSGFKDISPGRNFQFIPYVSGRSFRIVDARDPVNPTFEAKDLDLKAGLDAKAVIKDSFVLDATINPDFGQVESDEPQVTVNQRFEVLFPEKRPFFQENSGYFATPINLVFTRRIADPLYGIRLTGKRGPWSVGTLFADDQSPGESVAPNDPLWGRQAYFGIVRVSREIDGKGSNIGLLYTDRELNTDPNTFCTTDPCITRTNRVGGLDAHIKFNKNWQLDGQAVGSETRLNDGSYYAGGGYYLYLERSTRNLEFNSMYKDNAPGFQTRTGFFQRPDIRWFSNFAQRKFYVEGKHLLFHGPSLYTRNIWDHNGLRIEYFANTNYRWVFNNRNSFGVYANYGRERLRQVDYSQLTANVDIPHDQFGAFFNSDYFNWMTLGFEANLGRDTNYDPVQCGPTLGDCPVVALPPGPGKSRFAQFSATFRPGRGLTVENTFFYYALRDLQTNLNIINNYIARSKWNYQFTRNFSLRVIGQYNGNITNPAFTSVQNARNFNADVLFTYLLHPGTAVYVGYNTDLANIDRNLATDPTDYTRLLRAKPFINDGRQFFVKLSYLLRF